MQKSVGRRAASRYDEDDDEAFEAAGMVARMADRAFDNPAMSGGLIVMGLTALAIVSNATLLQSARHPDPLFMTRPSATVPASPPLPVLRPHIPPPPASPPLPRVAPTPAATSPVAGPTLVADLQRALAGRGLYKGTVDGISGSRTRAAISAYQSAEGLPVTGEATAAVLDHIRTASVPSPAPAAEPAPPPPVASPALAPAPAPILLVEPPATAAPAPMPEAPAPAAPSPVQQVEAPAAGSAPAVAPSAGTEPPLAPDADAEHERYREVQEALNLLGYGPVPADGGADAETANAIRRFELDNGLPITGKPGDRVIERLIAIGAMKAT